MESLDKAPSVQPIFFWISSQFLENIWKLYICSVINEYEQVIFHKVFEARVNELWTLYTATGELDHNGEKGLLREIFFRGILESVLPPHFGVGSGIVIDKWERQSPQIDLVIYDRRKLPPIFENQKHGIYPIDSVLRLIEIKSTLDKDDLFQLAKSTKAFDPKNSDGLKTCATGNLTDGQSYYPFVSLFAYNSKIADIATTIATIDDLSGKTAPICIANRGIFNIPHDNQTNSRLSTDITINVRHFLVIILSEIEATAASRKEYSLAEWLA